MTYIWQPIWRIWENMSNFKTFIVHKAHCSSSNWNKICDLHLATKTTNVRKYNFKALKKRRPHCSWYFNEFKISWWLSKQQLWKIKEHTVQYKFWISVNCRQSKRTYNLQWWEIWENLTCLEGEYIFSYIISSKVY